tara:strand:+ start:82 stop:279 length:198 start_codon:yes stop_codon:yes gene_type:complete
MVYFSHIYADFKADIDGFCLGYGFDHESFFPHSWYSSPRGILYKRYFNMGFGFRPFSSSFGFIFD